MPPENMLVIFVTLLTSQPPISWLKEVALRNMYIISVTLLTSQPPIFWLKEVAPENILSILVTLLTSQPPMFWLKEVALRNIHLISVTVEGKLAGTSVRFSAPSKAPCRLDSPRLPKLVTTVSFSTLSYPAQLLPN